MKIKRVNLMAALARAIDASYIPQSSLVQGWREVLEALKRGEEVTIETDD